MATAIKMTHLLALFLAGSGICLAQDQTTVNIIGTDTDTASTIQILDTAIPFAIGAREAEQTIRASFGWQTFQEGFVRQVYYRFDPDGYARFSTSPRLDEDVFEVICNGTPTSCVASKQGLAISLAEGNAIRLTILDAQETDTFFLANNATQLPLPPSINGVLDPALEALLATGDQLQLNRNVETISQTSLSGFGAVTAYLRWVANAQDSNVLPRDWPITTQRLMSNTTAGLTSPEFEIQAARQNAGLDGPPTGNGAFQDSIGQNTQFNGASPEQRIATLETMLANLTQPRAQRQETLTPTPIASPPTLLPAAISATRAQQPSRDLDELLLAIEDQTRRAQAQFATLNEQLIQLNLMLAKLVENQESNSDNPIRLPQQLDSNISMRDDLPMPEQTIDQLLAQIRAIQAQNANAQNATTAQPLPSDLLTADANESANTDTPEDYVPLSDYLDDLLLSQ